MKKILILLSIWCITAIYAREEGDAEHIWEGNLAVPPSQQLGTVIAIGQNIVEKNDLLLYFQFERIKGHQQHYTSLSAIFLYGLTDKSSLFITIPTAADFKENNQQSSGIGDISIQYEYAYFNKDRPSYAIQATVLGEIGLPTGSIKKQPYTGFGSTSFLLGATLSYLSIDWYAYASPGVNLTTSRHGSKIGNQYLYQAGIGKNIAYKSKRWTLAGIFEFGGNYQQRDKINNTIDKNSGGNTVIGEFSLWFSTQKLILLGSIGVPVTQHLFGKQNKNHYEAELSLGWKFN